MKKAILLVILLAALAAVLIFAFCQTSRERATEKSVEAPVLSESRVKRTPDGSVEITLQADTQKRLGLKSAPPAPITLSRELPAFGRVLDPASLISATAEIAEARRALLASTKELERLRTLAKEQNTSTRSVEVAEAAVSRDQIALENAQWKLVSTWGQTIAGQTNLPTLVKALAAKEIALVRLDLPAGQAAWLPPAARLFTLAEEDKPILAQCWGRAPDVDGQAQGVSFLFLVMPDPAGLRPGQAVRGYLAQPGPPWEGVSLPVSAIIRAGGKAWVYVQSTETLFRRQEVALDHAVAEGWLVTRGLSPKDRLVVTGAQLLYSEELKSRIQVGD